MEKIYYEIKPFICLYLGYAAFQSQTMLRIGRLPATALIICGLMFLFWRLSYRGFFGERGRKF